MANYADMQHPKGTAPFNEIEAQFADDNGQRDDAEPIDPEAVAIRAEAERLQQQMEDGFMLAWSMPQPGKPARPYIAPTLHLIHEVKETAVTMYQSRETRQEHLPLANLKKLRSALTTTYNALAELDGFAATGWLYNLSRSTCSQIASSTRFLNIFNSVIHYHARKGNEDRLANAQSRWDDAHMQCLSLHAVLDWIDDFTLRSDDFDKPVEHPFQRETEQAMKLEAWKLSQRTDRQHKQAVRATEYERLYGDGRQNPTPEDVAIAEEEAS